MTGKFKINLLLIAFLVTAFVYLFSKDKKMRPTTDPGKNDHEPVVVTEAEKTYLLTLARQTLDGYLKDKKVPDVDKSKLSERLTAKKGCFVTLTRKDTGLRGCIGHIFPVKPLYQSVMECAISSAVHDSRFHPVTHKELRDIRISLSVLTVPADLAFTSPQDLLNKLIPLKHGVVLKTRYGSSTFLPQVWGDLPDKRQFLSRLCMKHGAPADEWEKEKIKVQTYQAVVFKENNFGGN